MCFRFLLFCPVVGAGLAQPTSTAAARASADSLPPIFAPPPAASNSNPPPTPPSDTARPRRAISPEMAAKLSATVEASPAVAAARAAVASTAPTTDAPGVMQLAPYIVREKREPNFKEREILTPKGKLDLARRRYPMMTKRAALERLEDDFARERMKEMGELNGLLQIGGEKPSPATKRKIEDAMRPAREFPSGFGEPMRPPR
jgi:hypothetical protein